MEGLIPVLSGLSDTGACPYSNVGFQSSNVWQGGYVNQSVGTHLSSNAMYTAWTACGRTTAEQAPGVYRADPAEIVANGGDIMRLANDMITQGAGPQLPPQHRPGPESPACAWCGGLRVPEPDHQVHPEADRAPVADAGHRDGDDATSSRRPGVHVANAWEMTCVQDYVSIAWPVIDATFRYSIFLFGALTAHAPQYSGILQGLQVSDVTPYS